MFGALMYTSDNDKNNGSNNLESFFDKTKIMLTYTDFFSNLCKSLFLFSNLKPTMRNDYLNSLLIDYGHFAFVRDDELGLVATPYSELQFYDLNGNPTKIQCISPPNVDTRLNGKVFESKDFTIVKLNPQGIPLRRTIMYFCDKIAENQRAIDQNVYSCQTPVVYEIEEGQEKAVTELQGKLNKMVRNIILKKDKRTTTDMVKQFPTPDFKGDKFITNIQYYEGEMYNFCGFKHTPFEKRERLLAAEVTSNDEILNTTKAMMFRSIQEGIKETNEKFNVDFKVEYVLTNRTSNFDVVFQRETESSDIASSKPVMEGDVVNGENS